MIGNDIVDLTLAAQQSNWRRPRWLAKQFTEAEQALIAASERSERTVWLLWSMKESAYKVIARQFEKRFFAPRQFVCSVHGLDGGLIKGLVRFKNQICQTRSQSTTQYVHSWTVPGSSPEPPVVKIVSKPEGAGLPNSNQWLYQAVIDHCGRESAISDTTPRIQKNALGIPQIFVGSTQQSSLLSLSHHGRFGAFVMAES